MIEKLAEKMVNKQLEENMISKDDVNIYRYGYILIGEVLINIIIAIMIAGISREWITVILFLIIYIPLRSFCGGWHADKFWKCTIYSNLMIVLLIISSEFMIKITTDSLLLVVFLISSILILKIAPVDTKSKSISIEEKEIYKKKINRIQIFHFLLVFIILSLNYDRIMYIMVFSYVTQVFMLVLEKITRKSIDKYF